MIQIFNQIFSWKQYQRLILSLTLTILATFLVATPANATGVYDIPTVAAGEPTWVIDEAEAIGLSNQNSISDALAKLAQETGNEVRIVTFRRLDYGETPETLVNKLFEKWFPTPELQANQTILLIDTVTNGTAIRVGDKSKSLLTDAIATSVAEETVRLPLREGDKYNQAFLAASDRLVAVLSGQEDPGPPQIADRIQAERTYKTSEETNKEKGNSTIWVIGLLIAATIIPMATYYFYQGFSS